MSGAHRNLNVHGACDSENHPIVETSLPAYLSHAGMAIHTRPSGRPEANDCSATAARRGFVAASFSDSSIPGRFFAGVFTRARYDVRGKLRTVNCRSAVAAVAAAAVVAASGCVAVQVKTTADVIVETSTGHDHYEYEGIESFDTAPIALLCVITVVWYGGACWAYLAMPFDDQERAGTEHAKRDVGGGGECAHLRETKVEKIGWTPIGDRKAKLTTLNGDVVRLADAQRTLCSHATSARAPPPPDEPTPTATSPPPTSSTPNPVPTDTTPLPPPQPPAPA